MEPLRRRRVGAEKRVIQLYQLRVFERNRPIIPDLNQFTNGRPLLHCTIFLLRENVGKHPFAVKLHLNHILVEFDIVCDDFAAPVGRKLEIKQRNLYRNALGARYFACYSVNRCGLG